MIGKIKGTIKKELTEYFAIQINSVPMLIKWNMVAYSLRKSIHFKRTLNVPTQLSRAELQKDRVIKYYFCDEVIDKGNHCKDFRMK